MFLSESISILLSDIKKMEGNKLQALKGQGFYLFDWQQDWKNKESALQVCNTYTHMYTYFAMCMYISVLFCCFFLKSRIKTSEMKSEKEQRLRVLFRILGTQYKETQKNQKENKQNKSETKEEKKDEENSIVKTARLHDEIVKTLCEDTEWSNYVLTFDNILKMVAIFLKVRTNTPIILMGETGCGKTSLIKCLGHAANVNLVSIDVHGGFDKDELRKVINDCSKKVSTDLDQELWLFLDEINTSPDIGWFKELICDHSLDGVKVSPQIKVIAACNPYRQRKVKASERTNTNDYLNKWVYRVFPMCETMKEYIWPFGQLNLLDEKKYIWAMTKQMKEKFESTSLAYKEIEQWETVIAESISKSQEFLRPTLANEAIISLRDASRCLKFFHWLMQHRHEGITVKGQPISWIERALNIALSLSYYFRLDEAQRKKYSQVMSSSKIPWFSDMVNEEITLLSESFQKPAQVAFHKILKENLFVLFFCIVTETPMILVGEPGTSKTLSLRIVLDTLSYHNINDFHQKLKTIISYFA
ncbi:hypothetical protein RFI_28754 [Reticulomyxa filosa]|uniref:AAA+ ATPase domain-containing protein n=1 Tax=Reticulomyxa filosa TaxID=46433 RepID=X6M6H5_RETFI|nr:hypothetical protein RFI_28754 [Reticulomyxa filosa]|eukprot:ETO08630.1 hypothetical protein RFI_28754 [Reticulomyxa filosa]